MSIGHRGADDLVHLSTRIQCYTEERYRDLSFTFLYAFIYGTLIL